MDSIRTATLPVLASDPPRWTQLLARYRAPNQIRSITEIAVTVVPLAMLWVLA
jgi:omega-6 fatty acid desaturase (delta-12 desaturase)